MPHYVCKGINCRTFSDRPSVCLSPGCTHRYRLLHECGCDEKEVHLSGAGMLLKKYGDQGNRVHTVNFGLALGILSSTYFFFLGILSSYGFGVGMVERVSAFYIGYGPTFLGSIAGGLWGLVDGFVGGVILASLYNLIGRIRSDKNKK